MKPEKLALEGGKPVRTKPLPLEFPGVHHMDAQEVQGAVRVLKARSPFRYYGMRLQKEVEKFESELAQFYAVKYAVAVSSGTGALHAALSALGVGPEQEVIVPAYLGVSVLAAVVNHAAIPVVADIEGAFCLNPADVERRITPDTTGIIMVHRRGAPGDIEHRSPAQALVAGRLRAVQWWERRREKGWKLRRYGHLELPNQEGELPRGGLAIRAQHPDLDPVVSDQAG